MALEYFCPECGDKVILTVLALHPPINKYTCLNQDCNYEHQEQTEFIRVPAPTREKVK